MIKYLVSALMIFSCLFLQAAEEPKIKVVSKTDLDIGRATLGKAFILKVDGKYYLVVINIYYGGGTIEEIKVNQESK
jgi:hypothetical protein